MSELLAVIRAKAPELQERGAEIERLARLPDDIVDWLFETGAFKLMVPEEFGGTPLPLPELLAVLEELSVADGSIGWNVNNGTGAGYFIPSFNKETARRLFAPERAVCAGTGFPAGRARRVSGGYRVSGLWRYASGCQYASVFTGNAVLEENGTESVRAFAFFREEVRVIEDWEAFGLKGTASHSWHVDDVFVPEERSFVVGGALWPARNPVYRLSFSLLAALAGGVVRIGIARRFFELAEPLLRPQFQDDARRLIVRAAQNRELFYALVDRFWPRLVAGGTLAPEEDEVAIETARRLVNDTIRTAQKLFPLLRMGALWEKEPINRVYRDLLTSAHAADLAGL